MSIEPFGPYELLQRLGRGGMAEVFLARTRSRSSASKLVALKRLLPGYAQDRHILDLLIDEARISIELDHPNIVHVFDFVQVDGCHALVMEYVEGVDLRALLPSSGTARPLALDVALRIVICLLDALEYAHERCDADGKPLGIVHRDVTPHNVLVSRHGQPKLGDFGVARAAISSHLSRVGDIRGKFSYMPPEQAVGGQIDRRVDIFAAGAVLYELVTGQQPFRAEDSASQLFLLERGIAAPSRLVPSIPSDLDAITLCALCPDAAGRFARARDFAFELRTLMGRHFAAGLSASVHRLADQVERALDARRPAQQFAGAEPMRRADFPRSADHSLVAPASAQAPAPAPLASPNAAPGRAEPQTVAIDSLLVDPATRASGREEDTEP